MTIRPRLSFTITILIAFTSVFSLGVGVAVQGFRDAGDAAAVTTADLRLSEVAQTVAARANALVQPVLALARHVADTGLGDGNQVTVASEAPLLSVLAAESEVRAVSVGWPDGTLLQAAPLAAVGLPLPPDVPAATAYVLRVSRSGAAQPLWMFFDTARVLIGEAAFGSPEDPRQTQWYLQARDPGVHISTLYMLPLPNRPGLSVSTRLTGGGVVSLDITLDSLRDFLRAQRVTPHAIAFLFSDIGILLAHPDAGLSVGGSADGDGEDGGVTWTTLRSSGDSLLRGVWDAYASAQLSPGSATVVPIGGTDTLVRLETIESMSEPPVLVAVAAPRADFTADVDASVQRGTMRALVAFALGLLAIGLVSWRIAHPLGVLTREAQAIRHLDLSAPMRLTSRITEIERLAEAMAAMKATLANFMVYLPRDLVRQFVAAGTVPRLGGERLAISLLFTDVQGFTTISETLDPMDLTRITSVYFEAVTHELLEAGATIDKYIGDAVMAFWNAPGRDSNHAAHACLAALRTRAVTVRLTREFVARDWPPLPTRFGLHTGEAVVGNVGSSDRMTYTAMGAMVNLANRLEGLNKLYGTQILVTEATVAAAGRVFVFRPVDIVVVKGTAQPVPIYELVGLTDPNAAPDLRAREEDVAAQRPWAACIAAYREGRFGAARAALEEARRLCNFPLAAVYAARLAELGEQAAPGWSPLVRLTVK